MKYERFDSLAAMTARAIELLTGDDTAYLDQGIYDEQSAKRPCVLVVREGQEDICLRWNAFASLEESINHYGPRARRDANEQARKHVDHINAAMAAIEAAPAVAAGPFVIRSMSTTDYVVASRGQPGQMPVAYHIYLLPAEKRAGAWWTRSLHEAAKFATMADAKAQQEAYPQWLASAEIAPRDADARGLPTFWDNQKTRAAARI